ncbi:flavodoxin domain-containing protein [Bifidobacterium sp.]|jgi:sulfite reductase (NADPH) flavoprotein alpha-component|uniref:flavodoxin domain-containing protein n=1 Tax=Bifidobacterium sp. TaxID=41200 RepID=UPI0025C6D70B|nr:flavodoxin domain-containing protein [Bifidobacterium sp.]MCI1636431.1 flavodoxin domain-containing protein [Bifidobacterium sp.]
MGNIVADDRHITILVASETGNSLEVGEHLQAAITPICESLRLVEAYDYNLDELESEDILLMITSTQGEGEPPYGAEDLYDAVVGAKHNCNLKGVSYAVLGLGDSAYAENFNLMARQFDARFEQLGAKKLLQHGECDFDYEDEAARWIISIRAVVQHELEHHNNASILANTTTGINNDRGIHTSERLRDPSHIATLVERETLTSPQSHKHVYRIRLQLPEEVHYEAGDLLAITYVNTDETVKRFLDNIPLNLDDDAWHELARTLKYSRDITRTTAALMRRYAEQFGNIELLAIINDEGQLREYAQCHTPYELFHDYPAQSQALTPESLLAVFTSPCRRMYSISNAQALSHALLDLTVTEVEYVANKQPQIGECSRMLTQSAIGTHLEFAVVSNERFRLPQDQSSAIVMVALGSAIAPYRAFLQERSLNHESYGRNWLILGNRNPKEDYLYHHDLQDYVNSGLISELDVAWSRFDAEHHHVQDIILDRGNTLWEWINAGAYIYLCGHGRQAVASIEMALRQVIATHSGLDEVELSSFINNLKASKRLQY